MKLAGHGQILWGLEKVALGLLGLFQARPTGGRRGGGRYREHLTGAFAVRGGDDWRMDLDEILAEEVVGQVGGNLRSEPQKQRVERQAWP